MIYLKRGLGGLIMLSYDGTQTFGTDKNYIISVYYNVDADSFTRGLVYSGSVPEGVDPTYSRALPDGFTWGALQLIRQYGRHWWEILDMSAAEIDRYILMDKLHGDDGGGVESWG